MTTESYPDPRAVEMAIKSAAKAMAVADPTVSVDERIRQAHFDRLLCRVFSQGESSEWVLKGGAGMLARIPDTRATKDIDLLANGYTLEESLTALRRLAAMDLEDHFRFEYVSHTDSIAGDQQPYAEGFRVAFQAFLGTKKLTDIRVDLVAAVGDLTNIERVEPANRLVQLRLVTYPYRLYPIERQIADKVCATIDEYARRPSSREKDLVDLVVIANTHRIEAGRLRGAIMNEARLRGLTLGLDFPIPAPWGPAYDKAARRIPACGRHRAIADARVLMEVFIGTILAGGAASAQWNPQELAWL